MNTRGGIRSSSAFLLAPSIHSVRWVYCCCSRTGFIMMTPQLFINYKLKSVAHLPWRMLTYKVPSAFLIFIRSLSRVSVPAYTLQALNTFIDDLFAFIIKMPTLHRLACFRDGKRAVFVLSIFLFCGRGRYFWDGCFFFWRRGLFSKLFTLILTYGVDVVFFIYLYQRWCYRVDMTRTNEFTAEHEHDVSEQKSALVTTEDEKKTQWLWDLFSF
jgi:hypothetical protein